MMDELIYCVDRMYMENKTRFPGKAIYCTNGKPDNQKLFGIFRYVFEYYWQKDVDYIKEHLTIDTFRAFRINNLLSKVNYPDRIEENSKIPYILAGMYEECDKDDINKGYKARLEDPNHRSINTSYEGEKGVKTALANLTYAIQTFTPFAWNDYMQGIDFFASPKGKKFLLDVKLKMACQICYGKDALSYYFDSLPDDVKEQYRKYYSKVKYKVASNKLNKMNEKIKKGSSL